MKKNNVPKKILDVEKIISEISNIKIIDIRSGKKKQNFADARAVMWLILKDYFKFPYTTLAKVYNRDHTTIMSSCKRIRKMCVIEDIVKKIKKKDKTIFEDNKNYFNLKNIDSWEI